MTNAVGRQPLHQFNIGPAQLAAMEAVCKRLSHLTIQPIVAIRGFRVLPTRYMADQAACTLRYAATLAAEPIRSEAIMVAEQLENSQSEAQLEPE